MLHRLALSLGRPMRIQGSSMLPLLRAGDCVMVSESTYDRRDPRRGEVVAARPVRLGGKALVKRVAGLPHERVTGGSSTWQLGADEYLLLGDNAEDSLDSRSFGPVARHELIGPVWLRLWPPALFSRSDSDPSSSGLPGPPAAGAGGEAELGVDAPLRNVQPGRCSASQKDWRRSVQGSGFKAQGKGRSLLAFHLEP